MGRTPLDGTAGFTKLTPNKYLAQVTGVSAQNTLELPDTVYDLFDRQEGFLMERARISVAEDETLGQYSGELAALSPADDLVHGTRVPGIKEFVERREPVDSVCITFADGDTALSLEATGFHKVQDGNGLQAYIDLLQDE